MGSAVYRPHELVSFDGYYGVVRRGDHLPSFEIYLERGETFPYLAGWLFVFRRPTRKLHAVTIEDDTP